MTIDTYFKLADGTFKSVMLVAIFVSLIYRKIKQEWPWE